MLTGAAQSDRRLADYQWDVSARSAWGLQAFAGAGRFGAGLRAWTHPARQHLELDSTTDPRVRITRLDLVARARLASRWGVALDALASVGRMHLAYTPDHVQVPSGGAPVEVALRPIDAWTLGGGLALRRPITGSWAAGLELDTATFGMDTAHRNGEDTEYRHERFQDWNARIELARVAGRR